jgi:hypothetical protein
MCGKRSANIPVAKQKYIKLKNSITSQVSESTSFSLIIPLQGKTEQKVVE